MSHDPSTQTVSERPFIADQVHWDDPPIRESATPESSQSTSCPVDRKQCAINLRAEAPKNGRMSRGNRRDRGTRSSTEPWLDCRIWAEQDAGDHIIVIGQVLKLNATDEHLLDPLGTSKGSTEDSVLTASCERMVARKGAA